MPSPRCVPLRNTSTGGDLATLIANSKSRGEYLHAFAVVDLAQQLLEGLAYLHANSVIHRDIKPSNIYLTRNGTAKIGDFGVAKLLSVSLPKAATFCGTPFYLCPELFLGEKYSFGADVWALGVLLYELFTFHLPFEAGNVLALVNRVTDGTYDLDLLRDREKSQAKYHVPENPVNSTAASNATMSHVVEDLIRAMLCVDPDRRPTTRDLLHRFFALEKTISAASVDSNEKTTTISETAEVRGLVVQKESNNNVSSPITEEAEQQLAETVEQLPCVREAALLATLRLVNDRVEAAATPTQQLASDVASPNAASVNSPLMFNATQKYYDPKELEELIRGKALLYHRKRLAADCRRRRSEAEKHDFPQKDANLQATCTAAPLRGAPVPLTIGELVPTTPRNPHDLVTAINTPLRSLFEPSRQKAKRASHNKAASLSSQTCSSDAPLDDNDKPSGKTVSAQSAKLVLSLVLPHPHPPITVPIKASCSYRRLTREIAFALVREGVIAYDFGDDSTSKTVAELLEERGVDLDDLPSISLLYLDGVGEVVSVSSNSEWKYVVGQHDARHAGQSLSLRCMIESESGD